jgi:hypothetical protein
MVEDAMNQGRMNDGGTAGEMIVGEMEHRLRDVASEDRPDSYRRAVARSYANVYKQRGHLVPEPCEVCGDTDVEMHHDDYDEPLRVRWLCRWHHLEETRIARIVTEVEQRRHR